jgi:hypothetical protein
MGQNDVQYSCEVAMQLVTDSKRVLEPDDCIQIESFMVDALWNKVEPFLKLSPSNGFDVYSLETVRENCKQDIWQLWMIVFDEEIIGCFCTNITDEFDYRIVNCFNLVGKDGRTWAKALDKKICQFAINNGCIGYAAFLRDGVKRIIPELKEVGKMYIRKL